MDDKNELQTTPILSLLFSSASNFVLSHLPTLSTSSIDAAEDVNIPKKEQITSTDLPKETFFSFIQEIAGIAPAQHSASRETVINELLYESELVESMADIAIAKIQIEGDLDLPLDESVQIIPQFYQPVIIEKVTYEDPCLTKNIFQSVLYFKQILPHLPPMLREATNLTPTYSIERDGISLKTLYSKTIDKGPCLICIKDANGSIFGAFCSESFHPQGKYYGNGQSFLWKLQSNGNDVEAFLATGKNDYYVLSEMHCIAFGGGDGKFGLWIDEELFHGHSETCTTFKNHKLAKDTDFVVTALEIWTFII